MYGFSFVLLANICYGSMRLGVQQAILSKTYIVLAVVYNINLWVTSLQINKYIYTNVHIYDM